jgi:hypothetical protein
MFGGHGHGTNLAQILFWFSWKMVATTSADFIQTNRVATNIVWFLVAVAVWLVPSLVLSVVLRRKPARTQNVAIWSWLGLFLGLLFVWPQATVGP